ncbi:uncharacterized protein LOC108112608 [Drosophila eugracilis]|uniref:uncharacterized protein LOC108112608 n=1 Tax=Drosophila eugracilis TaxID=29029 RepID=UPI0007E7E026|nr:uncharacterized protein LOC108112608 [Drosophila eugracilis]
MENLVKMRAASKILVLQMVVCLAGAIEYQLNLDKDGVFAPCEDQPENPANFDSLLDMSSVKVNNVVSKVEIEGEQVIIWKDVQPGDTVKLLGQVYRLDKDTWQKTMFSASSNNFCKNMFEKNQYWYQFWTGHIMNDDEIKSKCLTTPGAVIKYKPYELELKANLNVPNLEGRYKLVLKIEAFDKRNVKRPVSICTEFRGTAVKL